MRRLLTIALLALAGWGFLAAHPGRGPLRQAPATASATVPEAPAEAPRVVDTKSDVMGPVAPGDSVLFMVHNFAAQHNGAVITCDSAVRYSDYRIEFFGNVLINKNTTYIYGERALYDGEINEARIFSELVKVVDGQTTLYTRDFLFNTLDNVGEFGGGGVATHGDNRLEAQRGYYYADTRQLVCVDEVELRGDEYELRGDSVIYDLAGDNAYFFDRTHIWNSDGDYLYADRGEYRKADTLYVVRRNGYLLTAEQELWSDSIDYYRARERAVLRRDIQIDDREHKVLAFGDYGEYWKEPGDALLTRRPSAVSYDLSQGPDSLYMRADTIRLFTVFPGRWAAEAAAGEAAAGPDSLVRATSGAEPAAPDSLAARRAPHLEAEQEATREAAGASEASAADTVALAPAVDSLAQAAQADSVRLTDAERKAQQREEARRARQVRKKAAAAAKREQLARIAEARREKRVAKLEEQRRREELRSEKQEERARRRLEARLRKTARKGDLLPAVDFEEPAQADTLSGADTLAVPATDSALLRATLDASAAPDSLAGADSSAVEPLYRLVKGFRNVKIYRTDFQAVCDSLTAQSLDSTLHLYIRPVIWNGENQITSEVMDLYTERQQLQRAEFVGEPMMVSRIDTLHYNQIAGKRMTAFFRENKIFRNDVNGNVRTIFYVEDGEPAEVTMMSTVESGDASFYIEENQVVWIVYRNEIEDAFYPLDQVPATQEPYLKGFSWEGARRPVLGEVFDRRVRPSERDAREALPRPTFPIMQRMDAYRKQLLEEGRWADRRDEVDPETVEWMREMGFEVGQPRPEGSPF